MVNLVFSSLGVPAAGAGAGGAGDGGAADAWWVSFEMAADLHKSIEAWKPNCSDWSSRTVFSSPRLTMAGFEITVDHPHTDVVRCSQLVRGITSLLAQTCIRFKCLIFLDRTFNLVSSSFSSFFLLQPARTWHRLPISWLQTGYYPVPILSHCNGTL